MVTKAIKKYEKANAKLMTALKYADDVIDDILGEP